MITEIGCKDTKIDFNKCRFIIILWEEIVISAHNHGDATLFDVRRWAFETKAFVL